MQHFSQKIFFLQYVFVFNRCTGTSDYAYAPCVICVYIHPFFHSLGTSAKEVTEAGAVATATSETYGWNESTAGTYPSGEHMAII